MISENESSGVHSEIFTRFQNMFPSVNFNSSNNKASIFESLDKLVKNLPIPSTFETNGTLSDMKHIVDGQELRIQLGMIQSEAQELGDLSSIYRKPSNKTQEQSWQENIIEEASQWIWDQDQLRSQNFGNPEFYSFID